MTPYYQDDLVTLYHGDCREVLPALSFIECIITDPPYGISYQSARRIDRTSRFPELLNDDKPCVDWLPSAFLATDKDACLACFCRWDVAETFRIAIGSAGFKVTSQGVWDRVGHGMGDLEAALAPQHDLFWFASKGNYAFHGPRPVSVYRSQRLPGDALVHPTQKPENLMVQMVMDLAAPESTVLDPFAGSGTTLVAAKRVGRKAIGIEIEERWCEQSAQRLSQGSLSEIFR